MPTSSDYDSQSDSGKDDHKDEESELVTEEVPEKEEPKNANETKNQGKADKKEDKKSIYKKKKRRSSSGSNNSHSSEEEEKIDTKKSNKKSKSSGRNGGKDRENKESGKRRIKSKKKRYSSSGSNQDQYSHGSDEQKSNGGESNTDGKHDSQSDNNKKDSERDDKGKYKDKEDDKGKDKKGGKNGRKIRSDSEDSDDKRRENKNGKSRRFQSSKETDFKIDTEYQKDRNSDRSSSSRDRKKDYKKGEAGKGKDNYRDSKKSNKNKKSNRKNDSDSERKSNRSNSDDNRRDRNSRRKDDSQKTSKNKKSKRDYSSSDEVQKLKKILKDYKTPKMVDCVFEPRDKTGVSYINKELIIKYIQYYFPDIQNIEQFLMIVPKNEYKSFRKKRKFKYKDCSCTSKAQCDLHYYAKKYLNDKYDNCDTENCVVVVMDTNIIDCKKMKKIVEYLVFREDKELLEEITEHFIEFLKENIDIEYNFELTKLKLIPCTLTLDNKTIQIKFIYDKNCHQNPEFLKTAICNKYEYFKFREKVSVCYSLYSIKRNMLKDFFQTNDDVKVLESLRTILNFITFEANKEECITGTMKKYLKAEFENKTMKDLENLILVQININEDCSVKYDEMIEQVFIRNAKFLHPIYKCSNPSFTVSFKLASKSIFLTTLDQSQKANVEIVKQEMITKIKEIFSNECTLKASYMFPLELLNECKAEVWKINGSSMSNIVDAINNILVNEITKVYSEQLKTDCDFSCIQLSENDTPKYIRKQYVLINYSFHFTSADNKANFEKKLMNEEQKANKSNRCSINECIIIDKKLKHSESIEEEHYEKFCEFLNERKKEIMKTYLFTHFEPTEDCIAIRGLENKITQFSKKNKKEDYDEHQFYGVINDFNKNQTSVKSIGITSNFLDLIKNFPSVLFSTTTLKKIKKITLTKALKLKGVEYYKHDKFTQEIMNGTIGWFITLCAEVNWNMIKKDEDDNIHSENEKLTIDIVNFIENLFSFKVRKNEDIEIEAKHYL